jgi:hypothetical protein
MKKMATDTEAALKARCEKGNLINVASVLATRVLRNVISGWFTGFPMRSRLY